MLVFAVLISGCGAKDTAPSDMDPSSSETSKPPQVDMNDTISGDNNEGKSDEDGNLQPDKIVTTAYIDMQTKDFIPTTEKLEILISKYEGYVQNSNISYNDYIYSSSLKYSTYSIRIPQEKLDDFINEVLEIGNVISKSRNKQDITTQYKDTESRLKVLEIKEERILTLLEKAEKMEDIIVLENQLSDVIYQKESLIQSLTSMDDSVDYSTVNLNLAEVAKLSPGENIGTPFFQKLQNAFKESFYFFTRNLGNLVIAFVYFLPYGLILSLIFYLTYKFVWKKRNVILKKSKDIFVDEDKDQSE